MVSAGRERQVRFLIAGCFNTALDFVMLNLLTLWLGFSDLVGNSISVSIGVSISYLLNHHFVFRYPQRVSLVKFAQFFAITGFSSLVLQNLVIGAFELGFDTDFGRSLLVFADPGGRHFVALNTAKVAAVLVGLVWNFTLYRVLVFRVPSEVGSAEGGQVRVHHQVRDLGEDHPGSPPEHLAGPGGVADLQTGVGGPNERRI